MSTPSMAWACYPPDASFQVLSQLITVWVCCSSARTHWASPVRLFNIARGSPYIPASALSLVALLLDKHCVLVFPLTITAALAGVALIHLSAQPVHTW